MAKISSVRRLGIRVTGKILAQRWGVRVRQALYHKDGTWYNNLEHFPGALFDPDGFIVFHSEGEYRACRRLAIGKETNVRQGIKSIPGYQRGAR